MFIHHPDVAKEFQAATPKGAKLPKHVKKSEMKKAVHSGFMKGLMKGAY